MPPSGQGRSERSCLYLRPRSAKGIGVSRIYNLFISHSWAYSDQYDRLVRLLNQAPTFPYKNYSVPRDSPIHTRGSDAELYAAIKEQIRSASCVLIAAGVYASHSKWIDKEITIAAQEYSKPIIGIKPHENVNVSSKVRAAAAEIVAWRKASIEAAIVRVCGG